ncbi:7141_t:CDS:2, partial [Acaulospora colombiana]
TRFVAYATASSKWLAAVLELIGMHAARLTASRARLKDLDLMENLPKTSLTSLSGLSLASLNDLEVLQESKIVYNQVVDELHSRDLRPRVDPLEKLPHEITLKILLDVSNYAWCLKDLLELTLVSMKWRAVIFSEPLLWNYI